MSNTSNTTRTLREIIDSDDEFPSNYEEPDETPAYLNDDRFETFKFSWINKSEISYIKKNETQNVIKNSMLTDLVDTLNTKSLNHEPDDKVLILKDSMSKLDLFCLLCYQSKASDASFMWFLHYLLDKDMRRRYKFSGCLIPELEVVPFKDDKNAQKLAESYSEKNHNFYVKLSDHTN